MSANTITDIKLTDNELLIGLEDGSTWRLQDDAQYCCEHRFMSTDDDLSYYLGAEYMGWEVKDGPDESAEYDDMVHETQFLEVSTNKGVFTVVTHNEHNGWYGGFDILETRIRTPRMPP